MATTTHQSVPALKQRGIVGRWPTAAALVLAPLLIAVSDAAYAIATADGSSDETGAATVALLQAHPSLFMLATQATLVACLLIVPAAFACGQLAHARSPRLAATGAWIMGLGYIAYFGVVAIGLIELAIVQQGTGLDALATGVDAAQTNPLAAWIFILFVVGNLVGTPLLGAALWRSRAVPAWAAWLIMAWPVFHIAGLTLANEWFEVVGALCMTMGFCQAARQVLAVK